MYTVVLVKFEVNVKSNFILEKYIQKVITDRCNQRKRKAKDANCNPEQVKKQHVNVSCLFSICYFHITFYLLPIMLKCKRLYVMC